MSYPYLSDLLRAATGTDLPLPLPTFGLCVAGAMLAATGLFRREMDRLRIAGDLSAAGRQGRTPHAGSDPRRLEAFVSAFSIAVLLGGLVGARIFHLLEHLPEFIAHPWPLLFSRSGFSVMGGLICGAALGLLWVRRAGLPARPVLDAAAPALMAGYALGRIGCQISGDGDWGIAADMALKPQWLPAVLWAQTYDNNIYGVVIPPPGVYPAPLYETAMGLLLFGILWRLRRHPFRKGWLFALYLLMAGGERLAIEQIRINPVLDFVGIKATQAEMLSAAFVAMGLFGLLLLGGRGASPGRDSPL